MDQQFWYKVRLATGNDIFGVNQQAAISNLPLIASKHIFGIKSNNFYKNVKFLQRTAHIVDCVGKTYCNYPIAKIRRSVRGGKLGSTKCVNATSIEDFGNFARYLTKIFKVSIC